MDLNMFMQSWCKTHSLNASFTGVIQVSVLFFYYKHTRERNVTVKNLSVWSPVDSSYVSQAFTFIYQNFENDVKKYSITRDKDQLHIDQ